LIGAVGFGSTTVPQKSPVFVDMTGALSGKTISAMISTYAGFMVLDTNGFVYSWGDNTNGTSLAIFLLV
jgi:alpha-tubulin suppressor-like RCC1 family protein